MTQRKAITATRMCNKRKEEDKFCEKSDWILIQKIHPPSVQYVKTNLPEFFHKITFYKCLQIVNAYV